MFLINSQLFFLVSANTWEDIRSKSNQTLRIGQVQLPHVLDHVPFVNDDLSPPPREIKAAMSLLTKMVLDHGSCHNDLPPDTLMQAIASTSGKHAGKNNSSTKPNKKFIEDFLDFLVFNLTFNEFSPRSRKSELVVDAVYEGIRRMRHNHEILSEYIHSFDPKGFGALFPTGIQCTTDVNKILQRRRTNVGKLKNSGVRTSYPPAKTGNTVDSFVWVHHFFLLQFIVPTINKMISVRGETNVGNVHHVGDGKPVNDFLSCITIKQVEGYGSNDNYFNIIAWRGSDSIASYSD